MDYLVILILPPAAFIILIVFFKLLSLLTDAVSYKNPNNPKGKTKAYACGEDVKNHRVKPNYAEFFPIAFFFTIMHVITLMIATSPKYITNSLGVAVLFIIVAYLSILIIFRRERND